MYTISSPLPAFSERVFFSIIGRYTYITNKSGSKQGLFGRDVVRIVQYLQTLRKKEATFQDLFVDLSLPDSAHEAIYSVFDALADKGFFQPPTTAIQYFGVDEQIFRIQWQDFAVTNVILCIDRLLLQIIISGVKNRRKASERR